MFHRGLLGGDHPPEARLHRQQASHPAISWPTSIHMLVHSGNHSLAYLSANPSKWLGSWVWLKVIGYSFFRLSLENANPSCQYSLSWIGLSSQSVGQRLLKLLRACPPPPPAPVWEDVGARPPFPLL